MTHIPSLASCANEEEKGRESGLRFEVNTSTQEKFKIFASLSYIILRPQPSQTLPAHFLAITGPHLLFSHITSQHILFCTQIPTIFRCGKTLAFFQTQPILVSLALVVLPCLSPTQIYLHIPKLRTPSPSTRPSP